MSEEVVGVEVEGGVIVSHRASEVVLVESCQGAIDIVVGALGLKVDGLVEIFLGILPLLSRQTDDGKGLPRAAIIGVDLHTLVEGLERLGGVFLVEIDLGTHVICKSETTPFADDGVYLIERTLVVLHLHTAYSPVLPISLILRTILQSTSIVADCILVFLLLYASESAKFV